MGNAESAYKKYIKETNMNEEMTSYMTNIAGPIYNKYKTINISRSGSGTDCYDYDDQRIIDGILSSISQKYGGKWYCTAGKTATFGEQPRPRKFIYFHIDMSVILNLNDVYRIFIYSYE